MQLLEWQSQNHFIIDKQKLLSYFPEKPARYYHILGVVSQMKKLLPQLNLSDEAHPSLIQAAYLHDIGYSGQLNHYDYHPIDGAVFAHRQGFSKSVIAAIMFHSESFATAQKIRPDLTMIYDENQMRLDEQDYLYIDLVTYCDLHTSSSGEETTLQMRIADVINRYGKKHTISRLMLAHQDRFEVLIRRVDKMKKNI